MNIFKQLIPICVCNDESYFENQILEYFRVYVPENVYGTWERETIVTSEGHHNFDPINDLIRPNQDKQLILKHIHNV